MEFKLNKIDTDIRRKIQDDIKSDKVHSSKNINVNKELNHEKENKNEFKEKNKMNKKRFITIDGVKYNKQKIKIKAEKNEEINVLNSSGQILDTKK